MCPDWLKLRRNICDADEDVAGDGFAMDWLQAESRSVKILAHVPRKQQPPVQLVGPLVIGADELCRGSLLGRADARAPMAARIMKGADRAGLITHDHNRKIANLQRKIAAGFRQFAVVAGEQPFTIEDEFEIEP